MATANIIDQRTANLGLPLPNVKNNQTDDCPRIAESLKLIDGAYGDARLKAAEAVKISGAAAAEAQNARADATAALSAAERASADAASALGRANDAAGAAESAAEALSAVGQKLTVQSDATIYLGGSGASDVLCDGRGLIPELPFETMTAALAWVRGNIRPSNLTFLLQDDVDDGANVLDFTIPWAHVTIKSNSELAWPNTDWPKLICGRFTGGGNCFVSLHKVSIDVPVMAPHTSYQGFLCVNQGGFVAMSECSVSGIADNPTSTQGIYLQEHTDFHAMHCKFAIDNGLYLFFGGTLSRMSFSYENEFSGAGTAVFLSTRNSMLSYYTDSARYPTGSFTGKKYDARKSSSMVFQGFTLDKLPGTLAGVCDSSSTVHAA